MSADIAVSNGQGIEPIEIHSTASNLSELLEIKKTAYGGRAFFAGRDIKKGTTILQCNPFCSVIFKDFKKEVCAQCFSYDHGRPRRVVISKQVTKSKHGAYAGLYFCSESCRESYLQETSELLLSVLERIEQTWRGWNCLRNSKKLLKDSKDVIIRDCIEALSEFSDEDLQELDDTEYDMARLVVTALLKKNTPEWNGFQLLQSNYDERIDEFPFIKRSCLKVFLYLRALSVSELSSVRPGEICEIVGRDAGNAFGIWELPFVHGSSEIFGSGIYCQASFFDHDCNPNVLKQRVQRQMVYTTLRDVLKDEPLNISYIASEDLCTEERQRILRRQWHFDCCCSMCREGN